MRFFSSVVQQECPKFRNSFNNSSENSPTGLLTLMKPLPLVQLFKEPSSLVTSKIFFYLMLHHFLLVLKQWEVFLLVLFTETLPSQQRRAKSSQLQLTIKQRLESPFSKVNVNLPRTTRSSEILSFLEFQWLLVDIHRLKSPSILMLTVS